MSAHTAVFDPNAFYPFRRLVEGTLADLNDLRAIERFIRAIVLHDEMFMELSPMPYDPVSDEELRRNHPYERNVIVGLGPDIGAYEGLLSHSRRTKTIDLPDLSPKLREIALKFSNAEPGDPHYEAHIEFLRVILSVERESGSIVCDDKFARAAEIKAREYPDNLFKTLDRDWQEYARAIDNGYFGPNIPPVLGIVLSRCTNREHIPEKLIELRHEWANARNKVWKLLTELRKAETLKKANQIRHNLDEASTYFSPAKGNVSISPLRMFWDLFPEFGGGAIEAAIAGGDPIRGAAAAAGRSILTKVVERGRNFAQLVFGRGAFDLARRIRRGTMKSESTMSLLARFLSQDEKEKLGI